MQSGPRKLFLLLCIFVATAIASISHPFAPHALIQPFTFISQAAQYTANLRLSMLTCPLWLCDVEVFAFSASRELRDLTVWSDGARVVEELTSPTSGGKDRSGWGWWDKKATSHWVGPIAVLDPQISCWSFTGTSGFITLQLTGNASITSVEIGHATEPHLQKFAPQDFLVWALVNSRSFSVKEIPRHSIAPPNLERLVSSGLYPIQLGTFTFNATSHPVGQFFAVDAGALKAYGGRADKIMFHVLNNGGGKRTCLYHLRVFGRL